MATEQIDQEDGAESLRRTRLIVEKSKALLIVAQRGTSSELREDAYLLWDEVGQLLTHLHNTR